jgi:hypothetical protein
MKTLAWLLCGMAVWAATPLTGTWKLNRRKSTIEVALPSFIHNDTMSFRSNGAVKVEVPPTHFIVRDGAGEGVYRVDVSDDQKSLTLTRVLSFEDQSGKQFHTVLILEKQ